MQRTSFANRPSAFAPDGFREVSSSMTFRKGFPTKAPYRILNFKFVECSLQTPSGQSRGYGQNGSLLRFDTISNVSRKCERVYQDKASKVTRVNRSRYSTKDCQGFASAEFSFSCFVSTAGLVQKGIGFNPKLIVAWNDTHGFSKEPSSNELFPQTQIFGGGEAATILKLGCSLRNQKAEKRISKDPKNKKTFPEWPLASKAKTVSYLISSGPCNTVERENACNLLKAKAFLRALQPQLSQQSNASWDSGAVTSAFTPPKLAREFKLREFKLRRPRPTKTFSEFTPREFRCRRRQEK